MLGFFKKNRESNVDLIDRYISTWKKYDYNLNYKTENYQKTNRLAKELLHIENSIEENESFLEIYKEIILKCIETIG
jgi:hypothetical protein